MESLPRTGSSFSQLQSTGELLKNSNGAAGLFRISQRAPSAINPRLENKLWGLGADRPVFSKFWLQRASCVLSGVFVQLRPA